MIDKGAIKIPEMAAIKAAIAKLKSPQNSIGIPTNLAPVLLIAVALNALPKIFFSKNRNSKATREIVTNTTMRDCPLIVTLPMLSPWSVNNGIRHPSAPKNKRLKPTKIPCKVTAAINRKRTEAFAIGLKINR